MTKHPERILLPLDLGVGSLRALAPAIHLAGRLGVGLDVVTWSFSSEDAERTRPRIEAALADVGYPLPVQSLITTDDRPGVALAAEAARRGAMVTMASHARRGIGHAVLGSTAEDVVATAERPVVLVGPHVQGWEPTGQLIAAVDGSATAERIVRPAAALAAAMRMPLQLVEVIEAGVTVPSDVVDGSYVVRLSSAFAEGPVGFEILHGDPAHAIVRHATAADLLALTTRHPTGLSRAVLGSVAMRVVHAARCPVVVGTARSTEEET